MKILKKLSAALILLFALGASAQSWTSYTPTINSGLTGGSASCWYQDVNEIVTINCWVRGTANGNAIQITLPISAQTWTQTLYGYAWVSSNSTAPLISVELTCAWTNAPSCNANAQALATIYQRDGTTPASGTTIDYRISGVYAGQS